MPSKKILVIKLGALGDVIMATALLRRIQTAHRDDELWLLTAAPHDRLFRSWPGLRIRVTARQGLWATVRTVAWMRSRHFDRIYDLQSNDRTRLLCALSGAKERVGSRPGFPYTLGSPSRYRGEVHIFTHLQKMLAAAGLPAADEKPWLPIDPAGKTHVATWLSGHQLQDGGFVVMHAGASPQWPAKRWPHYAALARELSKSGLATVWIGAAPDAETNRQLAAATGVDASGEFDVAELAELGRHARFAVTNDSGPMHALSASGIPVFALFGPTDWRRSHALGQRDRVLFNPAVCPACARADRATATDHLCLAGVPVEAVLEKIVAERLL